MSTVSHVYRAPGTFAGLSTTVSMRSLRTHLSLFMLGLLLAVAVPVVAQPDELTGEFGKLSAKERARIAKEEEENAAKDPAFQALMAAGEELFRAADFDAALAKYTEARTMRPYNVYPKVKIQDLQALIAKRDEERRKEPPAPVPADPPLDAVPAPKMEPPPTPPAAEQPKPPAVEPATLPEPVSVPPPVRATPEPKSVSEAPPRRDPVLRDEGTAPQLEEGERVYKEGRSIVVETTVAEDGHLVRYRKVSHPWGEEYYFREGQAIPDRTYRAALGK
ncbi:MAG: hypothetical protein KF797_09810 [Flavobacteriales bacterium]|nr:hypothetical protein [Flavobacteriales bacterium]